MLTTQSSPPAPQAISWIWMSPVTWLERGRKQASCRPAGSSRRATAGTSRNSQTWMVVPTASRSPSQGQAHRGLEGAEVGVEVVPLVADHHELAGLVGGDQQRRAELPQQRGEVRRVDGPQRPRVLRRGRRGQPWRAQERSRPFCSVGSGVGRAGALCVVMFFSTCAPADRNSGKTVSHC